MIDLTCECGSTLSFPESDVGKPVSCAACGRPMLLACGQQLQKGGGCGDFDARFEINSTLSLFKTILLGGAAEISIGNSEASSILLAGRFVARSHCRLLRLGSGPLRWKLVDGGSEYGTFVNGERITEVELKPGDSVDVGEFELRFNIVETPVVVHYEPAVVSVPLCPSCGKAMEDEATICVDCGVDVKTGRAIPVMREFDKEGIRHSLRQIDSPDQLGTAGWTVTGPFTSCGIASGSGHLDHRGRHAPGQHRVLLPAVGYGAK